MKYRFEVHYMNKILKEVSNLMDKLDLGADLYAIKEIMTFTSKKNPSIQEIKETIIAAYQSCDCEVVHIEGGKVE